MTNDQRIQLVEDLANLDGMRMRIAQLRTSLPRNRARTGQALRVLELQLAAASSQLRALLARDQSNGEI